MDKLLLHNDVRQQLEQFVKAPAHAVMLLAPDGSGKRTIAESVAKQLLAVEAADIRHHPSVLYIEAHEKSIPIEDIRDLQKKLQLKTVGDKAVRRVVIIRAAHRMTPEAQNALLKLLEEPPADSVFILTASTARSVLPTIYSRAQHIEVKPPSLDQMTKFFLEQGHKSPAIQNALRYSGKRLGLAHAILNNDETHPLLTAVSDAKELLNTTLFERLGMVDTWQKSKEILPERLDTLERLCRAGLAQAAEKGNQPLITRWQRYYQAVYDTKASLSHNPNTKLLLTNLFLRLS